MFLAASAEWIEFAILLKPPCRVRVDDGNLYILSRRTAETEEEWSLAAFRELNP